MRISDWSSDVCSSDLCRKASRPVACNLPFASVQQCMRSETMNPSTPNLFGIHTQALDLWQRRTEVLANNLANADTPGYLARDEAFEIGRASCRERVCQYV